MKITKFVSLLAASLLAASIFTSCGKEATELMGFKEISADGHSYDLFVPDEWIVNTSTGITSAYAAPDDRSNISVTSFVASKDFSSIDALWESTEPSLKALYPDLEYVCNGVETTLDGAPAKEYIFTGTVNEVKYTVRQIVALYKGDFYMFTYTAIPDKYEEHTEDIAAILDYFTFN